MFLVELLEKRNNCLKIKKLHSSYAKSVNENILKPSAGEN